MKAILDTNILIYHLGGLLHIPFETGQFGISTLTCFELLRLPGMSADEERSIHSVISQCVRVPVGDSIADRAAALARTQRIGTIDLLIAATALELDVPLITKNVKDFAQIRELVVKSTV